MGPGFILIRSSSKKHQPEQFVSLAFLPSHTRGVLPIFVIFQPDWPQIFFRNIPFRVQRNPCQI